MKTVSAEALKVLSTLRVEGQTATITAGGLERSLYLEVDQALQALGGKWSRKLKAHTFDGRSQSEIADALEDVLACGGFVDKRQELGFFQTPTVLARRLVRLANIKVGHMVLEPSAGRGRLVQAIVESVKCGVTAMEIDPDNVKELVKLGLDLVAVHEQDFLALRPEKAIVFDRIVMNPPFRRNADIEHVLHAWKFLKPGGRLVSVMAAHCTFSQDTKSTEFRQFVRKNGVRTGVDMLSRTVDGATFYVLPDRSFTESGTDVNTVVVVLERAS